MSIIHKIVIIEHNTHSSVNVSENVTNVILRDNTTRRVTLVKISDSGKGSDGKSAYQIWLDAGNSGSVNDFLNSLKGDDGKSAYQSWLDQGNTGTEMEFIASLNGSDGLSAYEIWLGLGNLGSETDFINSLKGATGLSAYEVWLGLGNVGNQTDFINSLKGDDGRSAYEVWLDLGNSGTPDDFFNSLKGDAGLSAYEIWLELGNFGTEQDFIDSLDGLSAYQIWLNNGNVGSESDYLLSLKADNTLEEARFLDNNISGDIDANGNTILHIRNGVANDDPATMGQLNTGIADSKTYTDSVVASGFKLLGDYDLIGNNAYPVGIGSGIGGAIRRNDGWRVSVGGTFHGIEYNVGDIIYSLQGVPGQVDANWGSLDWNQQQATESVAGVAKIITTVEIQDENTTDNKKYVTGIKFWLGVLRFTMLQVKFSERITFNTAPRFISTTANQYLKTDANKDVVSVGAIPAADVTQTSLLRFSTDAEKAYWNAKQAAIGYTPENVANKSTDGIFAANSDVLYPSQKAVKTLADTKQPLLGYTPQDLAARNASSGYVGLTGWLIDFYNNLGTIKSLFSNANTAARNYMFKNRDGIIADDTDLLLKEDKVNKDASGGYVGMTLRKINFLNTLGNFTSFLVNSSTASRTYTFQDKDYIVADKADVDAKQDDLWTFERTKGFYYFNDFLGYTPNAIGDGNIHFRTIGTGAQTIYQGGTIPGLTNQQGVIQLSTGTSVMTGIAEYFMGGGGSIAGESTVFFGSGAVTWESYCCIETLSTLTDRFMCKMGFDNVYTDSATNIIGFFYDEGGVSRFSGFSASPNIRVTTTNNLVRTISNTGVAVSAGQWLRLRIEINAAATEVIFYINNIIVATHTTNIPTGTTKGMIARCQIMKYLGLNNRNLWSDYVAYRNVFTNPR